MPMPKRASVDDYFAQLSDVQRPHLEVLRELRFSPLFFATQKTAVGGAGYEAGEGFIKLPYDRELPTQLLTALMRHGSRSTKRPALARRTAEPGHSPGGL